MPVRALIHLATLLTFCAVQTQITAVVWSFVYKNGYLLKGQSFLIDDIISAELNKLCSTIDDPNVFIPESHVLIDNFPGQWPISTVVFLNLQLQGNFFSHLCVQQSA
ncbi:hypothetical protein BsWGS_00776 [Bradybaena similaris]